MTGGGPADASRTIGYHIYITGFQNFRMGSASAIAWVLFAFIFACTLAQNYLQRRWVHYEAGES
jgi:multiple sugar transport system permease protein